MPRPLAIVVALLLVGSQASGVLASPSTRSEIHQTTIGCDRLEGPAGTIFLSVGVADDGTVSGFFEAWSDPFVGQPELAADPDQPMTGSLAGGILHAEIPLVDASGAAAGSAAVDATLAPSDPPFTPDGFKDGNHSEHVRGTVQPLAVVGTLSVAGATYSLAGCYADRSDLRVLDTNPTSFVNHFSSRTAECTVPDATGALQADVFMDVSPDTLSTGISIFEGTDLLIAFAEGSGPLVAGAATVDLTLVDPDTGLATGETGVLSVTVSRNGDAFSYVMKNATQTRRIRGELFDVEGSLVLSGGAVFSLDPCIGTDATVKSVTTLPHGPKPGGKVPANDTPAGATTLKPGGGVTEATKGAAPAAEAPFPCMSFTDPFDGSQVDIPVGNTVWFKVKGTGATITLDTTGSDYDTVAAAYLASGSALIPIDGACVDDVPLQPVGRSLQSAVSFGTTAGVWYYVQVGGFPESFTYGTLKVALR